MPTNEERQSIAENLRIMTVLEGCKYAEQFYELLKETVMDSWDFHEFGDVADRLADLIEPEPERTCRMEYDNIKRGVYCSHCGERMDVYTWEHHVDGTAGYLYPFCYWCSAKVVEK